MSAIPDVVSRQLITAAHINAVKQSVNVWVTDTDAKSCNLTNLGVLSFAAGGYVSGAFGVDRPTNSTHILLTDAATNVGDYSEIRAQHSRANPVVAAAIRFHRSVVGGHGRDIAFLTDDSTGVTTERMRIKGFTGNVGIGTASPRSKVELKGALQLCAPSWDHLYSKIYQQDANGLVVDVLGDTEYADVNPARGGEFYLYVNKGSNNGTPTTKTLAIKSDSLGNVGLGTASPQFALHVVRTGGVGSMLKVQDTSNSGAGVLFQTSQGSASIGMGVYSGPGFTANLQFACGAALLVLNPANGSIGFGQSATNPQSALSLGSTPGKHIALFEQSGGGFLYGIGQAGTNVASDPYRTRIMSSAIEGLYITNAGFVMQKVPASAPVDENLQSGTACIWYDEANNRLAIKCKTSGNVVKTGYVTVA